MDFRKTLNMIANVITRAVINRIDPDGAFAQIEGLSGHLSSEVEVFQPQGLWFKVPVAADALVLSPTADTGSAVVGLAHDRNGLPGDILMSEGEGGLHYLGEWKVYLAADGTMHLGAKDPVDFVALASKVDAALTAITTWSGTHVHTGVTTGPGSSGPATPIAPHTPVGSTVLKAE